MVGLRRLVMLLVAAGVACGQPALTTIQDILYRADGTRFRDSLGRVVVLRGVDAGGRSKFAPFAPFDYAAGAYDVALASYMDRAASWGIDAKGEIKHVYA